MSNASRRISCFIEKETNRGRIENNGKECDKDEKLQKFVGAVFGDKGTNLIFSVEYYCCDRPNRILQIIYLAIFGATYYIIAKTSFSYIPGYYLSRVHRYTSLLAVGISIMLFLLTSFSDPGTVKAENVSQYLSAYPYDNIIYTEKESSTSKLPKWSNLLQNNCIGERNTRYLAFLLWHFLLCMYGTLAIGLVLAGRLKELKVVYILTVYYGVDNSVRSLAPHIVQLSVSLMGGYNFWFETSEGRLASYIVFII
ncbi:hypothetical protein REPUB_Repub06bG0026900 [Reevesia pubescens]